MKIEMIQPLLKATDLVTSGKDWAFLDLVDELRQRLQSFPKVEQYSVFFENGSFMTVDVHGVTMIKVLRFKDTPNQTVEVTNLNI